MCANGGPSATPVLPCVGWKGLFGPLSSRLRNRFLRRHLGTGIVCLLRVDDRTGASEDLVDSSGIDSTTLLQFRQEAEDQASEEREVLRHRFWKRMTMITQQIVIPDQVATRTEAIRLLKNSISPVRKPSEESVLGRHRIFDALTVLRFRRLSGPLVWDHFVT